MDLHAVTTGRAAYGRPDCRQPRWGAPESRGAPSAFPPSPGTAGCPDQHRPARAGGRASVNPTRAQQAAAAGGTGQAGHPSIRTRDPGIRQSRATARAAAAPIRVPTITTTVAPAVTCQ
ncbi:hypothetical protein Pen02_44810 [Plantactinospora endophytica]|uniref:Uncharacterized protein n=1 Tax=Plantactinospora endophytica TaxID=673535 RepID=A0ABQ4E4C1_9ACTN|nr:hypothetical protein Pen02_44810 [Plantactinospora endophytica]